ncbi:MAG: 6-phosphofructokinase [Acidobacteriota bacterium]
MNQEATSHHAAIKKVGILFSGGPAPAANAVISAAALGFLDRGVIPVGLIEGFANLESHPDDMKPGVHYVEFDRTISRIRNEPGVFIRTSRSNPGKPIKARGDLEDPQKAKRLHTIARALANLGVDALITLGGDDTLKTANYMHLLGVPTIHVPKTIDNDYYGIAWTFGFWTAVDAAKRSLLTLKSDAEATGNSFIVELMGRKAAWITYATGIASQAQMMVAAEDFEREFDPNELAARFVDATIAAEANGSPAGIICIAEGLVEKLPNRLKPREVDKHGNPYYGKVELCKLLAERTSIAYEERTGREKRFIPKQVGYETRTAPPVSYDVVLGSMLGYGASRLALEGKFGHMVSVEDNFTLRAIPFFDLIDTETLVTKIRMVEQGSDMFRLKEVLTSRSGD